MKFLHSISIPLWCTSLFIGLMLSLSHGTALAQSDLTLQQAMSELSAAKEQGQLGERQNGYLGVVQSSETAEEIADLINDARRAEYTRIAEQNNIAVSDVEAMAGKRAIERTPPGQYIEVDGEWMVKR